MILRIPELGGSMMMVIAEETSNGQLLPASTVFMKFSLAVVATMLIHWNWLVSSMLVGALHSQKCVAGQGEISN